MAVVLVTGGSSGIGLETVRRLAGSGHRVFCGSREPARAALPTGVTPVVMDVAEPADCDTAVRSVLDAAGRLDVLVNNAGITHRSPLAEAGDAQAHRIFEVNVFGPMRLARAAFPVMVSQGGGRIINVTSVNDNAPAPFAGWYCASKAALATLSSVLAAEAHGFGILVTVIAPGLFRTGMSEGLPSYQISEDSPYAAAFDALRDQTVKRLRTAGDPAEVARVVGECIESGNPPARIVVGTDAAEMERAARKSGADEMAMRMRDFVASLTHGGQERL
jgi:NAD(P)-dependent dehydrogenase (short-subunit alcohol dehydrogenase family)